MKNENKPNGGNEMSFFTAFGFWSILVSIMSLFACVIVFIFFFNGYLLEILPVLPETIIDHRCAHVSRSTANAIYSVYFCASVLLIVIIAVNTILSFGINIQYLIGSSLMSALFYLPFWKLLSSETVFFPGYLLTASCANERVVPLYIIPATILAASLYVVCGILNLTFRLMKKTTEGKNV